MSRGQLTYYFKTKEKILLAVFDHLLRLMHQRAGTSGLDKPCERGGSGWERLRHFLTFLLLQPPSAREFHSLQYTFLSQIAHRDDFRQRLASLYGEWREHVARDVADDLAHRAGGATVSPRTVATLVQAILHGLAIQRAADPKAYDRQEMLELCLDLLGSYLRPAHKPRRPKSLPTPRSAVNGAGRGGRSAKPRKVEL